jgi:hypothetical protein
VVAFRLTMVQYCRAAVFTLPLQRRIPMKRFARSAAAGIIAVVQRPQLTGLAAVWWGVVLLFCLPAPGTSQTGERRISFGAVPELSYDFSKLIDGLDADLVPIRWVYETPRGISMSKALPPFRGSDPAEVRGRRGVTRSALESRGAGGGGVCDTPQA